MGMLTAVCFSVIFAASAHHVAGLITSNYNYDTAVTFIIYDWTKSSLASLATTQTNFADFGCKTTDPFVIVAHGWQESCSGTQWVRELLNNFIIHRKGCILCLDYSTISDNTNYFAIVKHMDGIARTMEKKLRQLIAFGIPPANGMMYGFSFGAHVSFQAGRNLAPQKIGRIDACDPAGVAFDKNVTYTSLSVMDSATEVQCVHTSVDLGTSLRVCHKNWLMGYCGYLQFAAGIKIAHCLCPEFYNAAFWVNFPDVPNPYSCSTSRPITPPSGFKMGYFMPQGSTLVGDLFAKTSEKYPYN